MIVLPLPNVLGQTLEEVSIGLFFVTIIWKPLSLKMSTTLRVSSSGMLSAQIIREQRDAEAEKNRLL